ncbi:DUF4450 domain-containing protein [Labilibaculum sp. K2S]|uniref:DUF4450 domain-containing protein n=1 Tax=Labilibaculum sp. K2S TaxID=3056386 RepID=UPI0025A3D4E3|nr:DUF4450 domain-containing protein [Labilibaculum sp. K2S]MDM8161460.1 DUF4450 domain-containing protein [Labilibaculum sp. K2S]
MSKKTVVFILAFLCLGFVKAQNPDWSLLAPKLAGTLRIGVSTEGNSKWFSEFAGVKLKSSEKEIKYILKDEILAKGTIEFLIRPLADSKGAVMKLTGENIPEDLHLIWTYGGASNKDVEIEKWSPAILPVDCYQNVFSVEGNSFTLYYGNSRKLKILEGLTPAGSILKLTDANKQENPIQLLKSGKKTVAQVLTADLKMVDEQDYYFCFYFLNPMADYNYFMLPKLFEEGSYRVNKETEWMKSTPD